MIAIKLPRAPIPQTRPRVTRMGTYDELKREKECDRLYIRSMYSALEAFKEPIAITMFFESAYTKSMPKRARIPHFKGNRPDLDNLVKYVMDMGNGVLWEDDSLIVALTAMKGYAEENAIHLCISPADRAVFEFYESREHGSHDGY